MNNKYISSKAIEIISYVLRNNQVLKTILNE